MTTGLQRMRTLLIAWFAIFSLMCLHAWLFIILWNAGFRWQAAIEMAALLFTGYCLLGVTAYLEKEDHEHRGIYYGSGVGATSALRTVASNLRCRARGHRG